MSVGLNEAVSILTSTNNLHYELWMFYIVVATGLLSYRFSDAYVHIENSRRLIIIAGFIAFAISNLIAIHQNITHFNSVLSVLQSYKFPDSSVDLSSVFKVYNDKPPLRILGFHCFLTVLLSYVLYKPKFSTG